MADGSSANQSTATHEGSYPPVEALLAEVNALSIRLNQVGRQPGASSGLPAAAFAVLQLLERHGPHTVPQIARRRSTSRQNIQILVNRLEGQGCVELRNNPAHRRSALVSLTAPGRTLLLKGAAVHRSMLETLASELAEPEVDGATRLLNGIRRRLNAEPAPEAAAAVQSQASPPRRRKRPRPTRLDKGNSSTPEPAPTRTVAGTISTDEEEFPVSLL